MLGLSPGEEKEARVAAFTGAVQGFFSDHGIQSIEGVFKQDLQDKFIQVPRIRAYLTRPASDVEFSEDGEPIIDSPYEAEFYECCQKPEYEKFQQIPFRAESRPFYNDGSFIAYNIHDLQLQRQSEEGIAKADPSQPPHHVFMITSSTGEGIMTIGHIAEMLRQLQKNGEQEIFDIDKDSYKGKNASFLVGNGNTVILPDDDGFSFLVFSAHSQSVDHAFTACAVVRNSDKHVMRLGLCNSWDGPEYIADIRRELDEKSREEGIEPIPFFDFSLDLQTAEDDKNCSLYSKNFAQALLRMLQEEPGIRAPLASSDMSDADMGSVMKWAMKHQLTQFYDAQGKKASPQQLRQHFLHERWETGNQHLNNRVEEQLRYQSRFR